MNEDWITRVEAARLAGVHRNTVRLWEAAGRLRTRRVPGRSGEQVEVSRDDLGAILDERVVPAGDAERIAALEVEVQQLRERLEEAQRARDDLLREVLKLAREK
jgi:hypothetical protein